MSRFAEPAPSPAQGSRPSGRAPDLFAKLAPAVFVLLWSTGFIVARLIAPHADPFTFLTVRFLLSVTVFVLIATAFQVRWPRSARDCGAAILSGVLIHGFYLAGVFWAVRNGLPAGLAALVSGLQPLMTAMIAVALLHDRLQTRQWAGVGLGLVGVALVVTPALAASHAVRVAALGAALGATLSITVGTVWQKRVATGMDLRASAALQFLGATLVAAPLAIGTEPMRFDNSWPLWAGLLWSVLGLSVGAISLLLVLLARDAATDVAALFYLVPPVAAVLAFVLLGERLTAIQIIGMAVTTLAVKAVRQRMPSGGGTAGPQGRTTILGGRNG